LGFSPLIIASENIPKGVEFWRTGFGAIDTRFLLDSETVKPGATEADSAFIRTAFLVNSPQVILSLVYFAYNGAFTKFLLADELNGYGIERKGLRVSAERIGAQRVTYFLQLPYRYALPLMITSGLLHWMSSQAFFWLICG
jgi:hypothetical protein